MRAAGIETYGAEVWRFVMTHPLPLLHQGCWAQRLVAPVHLVAAKPENVAWAEAAAFPVPALTADQMVSETRRRAR